MDLSNIRTLTADEIEVRIGTKAKIGNGASLLLYKNSRVDMAILDELVGPMNWQRDHKELKGVIYCGVAIKNENEWIWKWDAGVESNTEPQKGEASDSFKRACVNWGIGRELYTSPFIWVNLTAEEWNDGKPRINFRVSQITYNKQRAVSSLVIVDGKGNVRYSFGAAKGKAAKAVEASQPAPSPAPAEPKPAPAPQQRKHLTPEQYERTVQAAASGAMTKDGRTIRQWLMDEYMPTDNELIDFDAQVADYKASINN